MDRVERLLDGLRDHLRFSLGTRELRGADPMLNNTSVLRPELPPAAEEELRQYLVLLKQCGSFFFRRDPGPIGYHAVARIVWAGWAYDNVEPSGRVLIVLTADGAKALAETK
jgi:hypothetical protein